jgi:hypothetical protein
VRKTPEYREKARIAALARWENPEQREIARARKLSDKQRQTLLNANIGHVCSEETRQKISASLMGRKGRQYVMPEETKAKLRAKALLRTPTESQLKGLEVGWNRMRSKRSKT